ncbi:MAG: PqqD family protein [Mediterranea massiliensis]|nr:PqqD family protein [Mediterranea massiliensis]
MKIKENYKIRQIAGENLVISQGRGVADMTKVISLNQSAVKLWEALADKEFTLDDAAKVLTDLYGIDAERAKADAQVWAERLISCGVIC